MTREQARIRELLLQLISREARGIFSTIIVYSSTLNHDANVLLFLLFRVVCTHLCLFLFRLLSALDSPEHGMVKEEIIVEISARKCLCIQYVSLILDRKGGKLYSPRGSHPFEGTALPDHL